MYTIIIFILASTQLTIKKEDPAASVPSLVPGDNSQRSNAPSSAVQDGRRTENQQVVTQAEQLSIFMMNKILMHLLHFLIIYF